MSGHENCTIHQHHDHIHGVGCGHVAITHGDHVDYAHDGHLHHAHGAEVGECVLGVSEQNPAACTAGHACASHAGGHVHGAGCGHEAVPHGDHVDYVVDGHLHHPHEGHCDHHGAVAACTSGHACGGHEAGHVHGEGCGHAAVAHGDHVDYVVDGHLHHAHHGHCDHHGPAKN